MPIISVRYNGNNGWKRNAKTTTTKTEKNKGVGGGGDREVSERVRAKWFCCAFKLGFIQLISKASLIFNTNFVSPVSFISYFKTEN